MINKYYILVLNVVVLTFMYNMNDVYADNNCGGYLKYSTNPIEWINKKKPKGYENANHIKVNHFQVVHTRQYDAITELEKKEFVEIPNRLINYYAGPGFKLETGKKAYLVRGVFDNLNGHLFVGWWQEKNFLEVSFLSLGKGGNLMFSPVVVQLPNEPNTISVTTSGAM